MRNNIFFIIFTISLFSSLIYARLSVTSMHGDSLFVTQDTILVKVADLTEGLDSLLIDSIDLVSTKSNSDILVLQRDTSGLIIMSNNWTVLEPGITFRDTMFYNPAFLPIVFDGKILPDNLDFLSKDSVKNKNSFHLIPRENTLEPLIDRSRMVQGLRKTFYMNPQNFEKIQYSGAVFSGRRRTEDPESVKKNIFKDIITAEDPVTFVTPSGLQKVIPKRIYWVKNGEHSVQVSQNYISKNWSKGGSSSYSVINNHKFFLNYEKDKVTFNNTWEWRLGLQSISGNTYRDIDITDDLFRMYNVFGHKAFSNWSYSSTLDTKTQIFNSYPVNSNERKTSFLSPLYVNYGVGMSYNLDKKFKNNQTKKLKLSMDISALSIDFRYVRDDEVNETKFGLKEGRNSQTDYGSKVNVKLDFAFSSFISWYSEFYYFTNYERIESEFQNKFNLLLNRYLSTTIAIHMRFDDNVPRYGGWDHFQMNERISFGLNYKW